MGSDYDTEAMACALYETAVLDSGGLPMPDDFDALPSPERAEWLGRAGALIQRWITRGEERGGGGGGDV